MSDHGMKLSQQKRNWTDVQDSEGSGKNSASTGGERPVKRSASSENGNVKSANQAATTAKVGKADSKRTSSAASKPYAPMFGASTQGGTASSTSSSSAATKQSTLPFAAPRRSLPWESVDVGGSSRGSAAASSSATFKTIKQEDQVAKKSSNSKDKRSANIEQVMTLSPEQLAVHNLVTDQRKNVFFTGSAGTGKSVLMRQIIKTLKSKYKAGDAVAITASTGLAACNISGVTIHNFAGIGIGVDPVDTLIKRILHNKSTADRWRRCKVLVIDEISMLDGFLFDKLNDIAKAIRRNTLPFGGIQLVVTGDFFQLPPVSKSAPKFAFEARAWKECIEHTVNLQHVFRQNDTTFVDMLTEMRFGNLSEATIARFKKLDRPLMTEDGVVPTELYALRKQVEQANEHRLKSIVSEERVFHAKDQIAQKYENHPAVKNWLENCRAPGTLKLKVGAQVMLTKNLTPELVNGTIGIVEGWGDPDANLSSDDLGLGEEDAKPPVPSGDLAPYIRWHVAGASNKDKPEPQKLKIRQVIEPVRLTFEINGERACSREQYPIMLAWAMSIHKSQGQTLQHVKVDLRKVFECGQSYVALSRATSIDTLQVLGFEARKVKPHDKVIEWSKRLETLTL